MRTIPDFEFTVVLLEWIPNKAKEPNLSLLPIVDGEEIEILAFSQKISVIKIQIVSSETFESLCQIHLSFFPHSVANNYMWHYTLYIIIY